jgi:phosphoadenosine phosphosulfate reductase
MPLGLQLDAGAEPAKLGDDLHRFSVICLQFDSFTDGRPYSQACLLHEYYGYRGELRARGNILRDQFDFMRRCGIDALEITK